MALPNPRWFQGRDWVLKFEHDGTARLDLWSTNDDGEQEKTRLTINGEAAARLAASALDGSFTPYGGRD